MKVRSIGAIALLAGASLLVAVPAGAATTDPSGSGITQTQPGTPFAADDQALLAELEQLAETQTAAEVADVLESGEPAQALYDVETNEYVAAFVEEPTFGTLAVTQRGPGCFTGDACIVNKTIGFYGTGQLTFANKVSGVTKLFAGSTHTTWWKSTLGIQQPANVTTTLTAAVTLSAITRS